MPDPLPPAYAQVVGSLRAGWERVRQGSPMAGADGQSLNRFDLRLEGELAALENELRTRTYEAGPLLRFDIPKPDGGKRTLHVPSVRDRVVQAAALHVLHPLLEAEFEHSSFGYRPGRSWKQALAHIEMLRDEGFQWVVDADIDEFFDSVDHELLLARLLEIVPDQELSGLVRQWVAADAVQDGYRFSRTQGLPQGAIISPILANLFLDELDEELDRGGLRLVRYADDFIILCRTEDKARQALELTEEILAGMELRVDPGKTRLTSFDEGFRYLGALFVRSLMMIESEHPLDLFPAGWEGAPNRPGSLSHSDPPPPPPSSPETSTALSAGEPGSETSPKQGGDGKAVPSRTTLERTAMGRALLTALDAEGIPLDRFVGELEPGLMPRPIPIALASEASEAEKPSGASAVLRIGEAPFRRTLYVTVQGAWLRLNAGRFVVTKGRDVDETVLAVPTVHVDQIVVFGHTLITPAALRHCLQNGISITLLSSHGRYYGQVESARSRDVTRLRLQVLHGLDPVWRLGLAARFIRARLHNARTMLRRYARRLADEDLGAAAEELTRLLKRIDRTRDVATLRGLEGQAAALYFGVFGRMLHRSPFTFYHRTRRPPTDPINAMLSFGYALLHQNIYSLARVHRLNPYFGVLHADRHGHPALVSDLIEEFRFLIERLVLRVCNEGRFGPADFRLPEGEPGCFLTDDARRRFIEAFEHLMRQKIVHPAVGHPISYRRCLEAQVRAYVHHLEGDAEYTPFLIV